MDCREMYSVHSFEIDTFVWYEWIIVEKKIALSTK